MNNNSFYYLCINLKIINSKLKIKFNNNKEILIIFEESKNLSKNYIYSTNLKDFYKFTYSNSDLKI